MDTQDWHPFEHSIYAQGLWVTRKVTIAQESVTEDGRTCTPSTPSLR